MQDTDDIDLLRRYAVEKSEDAFGALVSRHINLVYSAALRQVRNPHLAQEISQSVFLLLSKKAGTFGKGVILAGWLHRATGFVASDAVKSEMRRRNRETAAMEPLYEPNSSQNEIEPILDRAMDELGELDRNVVLLRYFEKKSLKDLGAAFGITEDAAQKRVSRALEKLREILERKGSSVTSTALTGALAAFASQTAPPALAASVLTITAASVAAPIALSFATQATLTFMAMTKMKLGVGAVVLLAAVSTPMVMQQSAIKDLRAENEALKVQAQPIETQPKAAGITEVEVERLRKEAEEVHQLRGQVAALSKDRPPVSPPRMTTRVANQPVNNEDPAFNPMARQTLGDQLAGEGKFAEALENYLWCFDEGVKHRPSYVGVRGSFLLMKLKELGEKYPPAKEALLARRDQAEAEIVNGSGTDLMSVHNLKQLYENLGEPDRVLALFDQLPVEHRARKQLVEAAGDAFIRASRYQDIVTAGNPEAALDLTLIGATRATELNTENDTIKGIMRRSVVDSGGRGIEALAAVGQIDRAKAMIDKVFKFDQSPETKGELMKNVTRAGNASVIQHLQSK